MKKIVMLMMIMSLFLLQSISANQPEPGTGFSTAPQLFEGSYTYNLEESDVHFFKVWLNSGQYLHVTLRVPRGQDFDLFILSPERELLERSIRPSGVGERISYQAPYPGYYYILVSSYRGSKGAYTLSVRIISQPTKVITVKVTEEVPSIKVISSPTIVVKTVTKTVYEKETITEIKYIERFPWSFIGLIAIGVMIWLGLIEVAKSFKAEKQSAPPQ
ncbi:MAG: hypothetical protein DRN49_00215 [Thaumarchaeota archaeon]|nr:MAG: hypothetical protein DRN49_00215 [Nitrososphaerota archaeon]